MADTIFDTRRRVAQRGPDIDAQVSRKTGNPPPPPPRGQGVTAEQARRTRRTGSRGEPAYGTPIRNRPETVQKVRLREAQTTDSNNTEGIT